MAVPEWDQPRLTNGIGCFKQSEDKIIAVLFQAKKSQRNSGHQRPRRPRRIAGAYSHTPRSWSCRVTNRAQARLAAGLAGLG